MGDIIPGNGACFVRHFLTGDIYAIVLTDGIVTQAAGPLYWQQVITKNLLPFAFLSDSAIVAEVTAFLQERKVFFYTPPERPAWVRVLLEGGKHE